MDLLLSLRNARARNVPWPHVAGALLTLEQRGPLDDNGRPWIQVAASVSGYSVNHLRRLTKAWQAIMNIDKACPGHTGQLHSLSASHAEVLARLWQMEPNMVREVLSAKSWPSYGELLAIYEELRSSQGAPAAAGRLAAGAFRKRVQSLLANRVATGEIITPYLHYDYAKPDLLHLTTKPVTVRAAYDCLVVPPKIDIDQMRRRFVSLATESSFFDAFWIVVSDGAALGPAMASIELLQLRNVGLMLVEGSRIETAHHPFGPPMPDRRKLHEEFIVRHGHRILDKWHSR